MTSSPLFSFAIGRALGTVVVTLRGALDSVSADVLGDVLQDIVVNQGNLDVAVDARDAAFVDPAAQTVLTAMVAVADHHGGRLAVVGAGARPCSP